MVNSVSSSSTYIQTSAVQSSNSQNSTLSSYQKEYIGALLENYDSSSLSSDDAVEIVSALKEQGIAASEELASVLADSGFDAKEIGDLAGVSGGQAGGAQAAGGPPPPPPGGGKGGGGGVSEEEADYITELLESLLSTEEDDITATTTSEATTKTAFEDIMAYTSRIVSLNEESQDKVMDLLDKYSGGDTELSTNEISTIVKHDLSTILSDPVNYNRVSFYA